MKFFSSLFETVNDYLVAQLGELGPLIAVGGLGLVLCLVALPTLMKKQKDPFKQLREDRGDVSGKEEGWPASER